MCADGKNFCLVMVAKDTVLAIKLYALMDVNIKAKSTSQVTLYVKVRRYRLSSKHEASAQVVTN